MFNKNILKELEGLSPATRYEILKSLKKEIKQLVKDGYANEMSKSELDSLFALSNLLDQEQTETYNQMVKDIQG